MYKDTIKNADALDMHKLLQENLSEEFLKSKENQYPKSNVWSRINANSIMSCSD